MEQKKVVKVASIEHPDSRTRFVISSFAQLEADIKACFKLDDKTDIQLYDQTGDAVGNFDALVEGEILLYKASKPNRHKSAPIKLTAELKAKLIESLTQICNNIIVKGEKRCTIVVLGASGAGKSSTINSLLGQEVLTISDKQACTVKPISKEVKFGKSDLILELIDTPGLKDEKGRDEEFIAAIKEYLQDRKIHCVLYVHDLVKTRFAPSDNEVVERLTKALGPSIWKQAIVVFTRSNAVDSFPKPNEIPLEAWKNLEKDERWKRYTSTAIQNVQSKFRVITGSTADIPIALVDNVHFEVDEDGNSLLVDGTLWKEQLVRKVLTTMDEVGALTLAPQLIDSKDPEIAISATKVLDILLSRVAKSFNGLVKKIKEEVSSLANTAWNFILTQIPKLFAK